jgi:hypothetical protein
MPAIAGEAESLNNGSPAQRRSPTAASATGRGTQWRTAQALAAARGLIDRGGGARPPAARPRIARWKDIAGS